MVLYNFKSITVVPSSKDFIDIVLSKTQRKTPTEIHKNYAISRIRAFYMRKVRYTQQNFHDKLTQIINDFPLLDDIHPFYADLINILYDRDHYKLALGQINNAKHLIDNIAKDYVRLLKYGDSLYRCKQLKRAAMGRMCTLMKKLGSSLGYLEQVRQHLARLPSIDPTTRTLILCGYPNVGKSSFMNKVTRADVDVQPYAFTTKSLFVGHTDYKYIRWQVIDTPGILDHPIEERNIIEMQSITAMAHLQAAILFIVDISMQCGHTIKEQISLFHSIKPLFAGKPLLLIINKIDVVRPESVHPDDWALIQGCADPGKGGIGGVQVVPMSTLTEEGVSHVKNLACDVLLEARVEKKLRANRVTASGVNKLHVAMPVARDKKVREVTIPKSVVDKAADADMAAAAAVEDEHARMQAQYEERMKEEEKEAAMWARGEVPGMNSTAWREKYLLKNPEHRFDIIPEILDGKNVADFVDPDIDQMLEELEREEDERMAQLEAEEAGKMSDDDQLDEEEKHLIAVIRKKKKQMKADRFISESSTPATQEIKNKEKTYDDLEAHLLERGFDEDQAAETVEKIRERSQSRSRLGRKRERSMSRGREEAEEGMTRNEKKAKRQEDRSRSRAASLTPKPGSGMKDLAHVMKGKKKADGIFAVRNMESKKGEGDRVILNAKPKHLFQGKRGIGKTQRR
eukprot:TRINITY_DN5554_c0_g1_i1.p1 TRINITY_DN5554_c0_g1~~TRINITY_DN5554_c0_g1_i1.p1  ORF type:complete len:685 (+),score=286.68 TRINITY_DN5554_c0_g1_i1:149-2203(+)